MNSFYVLNKIKKLEKIIKKVKDDTAFNKKIAEQALNMAESAGVANEEMIGFQKGYIRALTEVVDLIKLYEDDDPATVETPLTKVKSMGDHLRDAISADGQFYEMTYEETVEKLKDTIIEASLAKGKLVNPINSGNEKLTNILCTWNQMFKAMELAEKEWNEMKSNDRIFLNLRQEKIKGELSNV